MQQMLGLGRGTLERRSAEETGGSQKGGDPPRQPSQRPHPGGRQGRGQAHLNTEVGAPASKTSYTEHRAPKPNHGTARRLLLKLRASMRVTRVEPKSHVSARDPGPAHTRSAALRGGCARTCDRQGKKWRQGRVGPGTNGRQGAVARLRAAAGWNRSGRKWGRCLGFRSGAPRARPGRTGENNKMAAVGGGVSCCPRVRGCHKGRRRSQGSAGVWNGVRDKGQG